RRPRVTARSANGLSSLAFGSVVTMRSWMTNEVQRLRSSARLCEEVRPSLRCATRCLIFANSHATTGPQQGHNRATTGLFLSSRFNDVAVLVEFHSQAEPHRAQDVLDLIQRLAAKVLGLEHLT